MRVMKLSTWKKLLEIIHEILRFLQTMYNFFQVKVITLIVYFSNNLSNGKDKRIFDNW